MTARMTRRAKKIPIEKYLIELVIYIAKMR
jgi:hypothetical protein